MHDVIFPICFGWYRPYVYNYICTYYYMSCSISRPVSCPDVSVSARVLRTRADTYRYEGHDTGRDIEQDM